MHPSNEHSWTCQTRKDNARAPQMLGMYLAVILEAHM